MTRTLLIAYDVASSSGARAQIAEMLMSIGDSWARPLETVWMLKTRLDAEAVGARLAPFLDSDDGLMVHEARGETLFANTGLRWFRPRRQTAAAALENAAILAFGEGLRNPREMERAA